MIFLIFLEFSDSFFSFTYDLIWNFRFWNILYESFCLSHLTQHAKVIFRFELELSFRAILSFYKEPTFDVTFINVYPTNNTEETLRRLLPHVMCSLKHTIS